MEKAIYLLSKGDLVVIPTETVYGLAADATNENAVSKIFKLKGRTKINPLILHVSSIEMACEYGCITDNFLDLLNYFWNVKKSSLTVVVNNLIENKRKICSLVTANLDTIAIRIPQHSLTRKLIGLFGRPIAAPSANISNTVSPTSPEMVRYSFRQKTPFVLDGGTCSVGIESTIVDLTSTPAKILRYGSCTEEDIAEQLKIGNAILNETSNQIKAPGMLKKHYSPKKELRINADIPIDGEFWITFGPINTKLNTKYDFSVSLSEKGDLKEAAQNLFKSIHIADIDINTKNISIMPIPNYGLGKAINDRLLRASSL